MSAWAIIFTNNSSISFQDTNYDGADIVVTNCTVTVDGAHAFASLRVLNGGVLTHSFSANGLLANDSIVTNESHVLTGTDAVTLSQSNAVAATIVVTDGAGLVTYTNDVDYLIVDVGGGPITVHRTETSAIPDGGTVLVSYTVSNPIPTGLNLAITGDVVIASGGGILANARGYGGGQGPGAGRTSTSLVVDGSGGGHGGCGGLSSSNAMGGTAYDSTLQPVDKGSAGGTGLGGLGGPGGGAVKLVVGGTLQINGSISVNGADATNSRAGGGAGGSVWLSATTITGNGSISANGGVGEPIHGGGGGGGCIALYYSATTFTGTSSAHGGNGFVAGGAGTIYTAPDGNTPVVLVDNGGRSGTNTLLESLNGADLVVRNGAVVLPNPNQMHTIGNLLIASNSWMVSLPYPTMLIFTVTNNATIEAGGGIKADGGGYSGGAGPGAGASTNAGGSIGYVGGGGGDGGSGGAGGVGPRGGAPQGGLFLRWRRWHGFGLAGPCAAPGGAGGGCHALTVNGTLAVDGTISANGNPSPSVNGGGGGGGIIRLTAGVLTGTGRIAANGGAGNNLGGGGGGGRIGLSSVDTNSFSGIVTAYGGGGANWGGAGSVVVFALIYPTFLVDNGGRVGAITN